MRFYIFILFFLAMSCGVHAGTVPERVQQLVQEIYGPNTPDWVRESKIPGLYEIINNGSMMYFDLDKEILISGKILQLSDYYDLSEFSLRAYRREMMQKIIDDENTLVYAPKNKGKHAVYVFTDVDCHYCRKFHKNMKEINKLGIQVNYLFTPYQGKEAYARAVGVWCSGQRQVAMDRAKQGKGIPLKQCENPVDQHLKFAKKIGITGTPGILLRDGTLLRGMQTPQQMLLALQKSKAG